jgi:GxxExxY protein
MSLIYPDESYAIRGVIFEVHKQKGTGFLEKVYQECMEHELRSQGIPFEREKRILIDYKGVQLKQEYVAYFVCYGKIIVECKAVKELTDVHRAQVVNYLRATNMRLGFLVNFSEYFIQPERIINFGWQSNS